MAIVNGNTYLLYYKSTSESAGASGTLVGNLTNLVLSDDAEIIDITTKDDDGVKKNMPGLRSGTVTADLVFDQSATSNTILRTRLRAGTQMVMISYENDVAIESATVSITNFTVTAPKDDVPTASIAMERDGAWG